MRILTVTFNLGPGGRQRAAQEYARGYHQADCPSAVLAFEGGGPRVANLRREGIPVFLGGAEPEEQAAAIREAAAWRPEVIHLHSSGPPTVSEARTVETLQSLLSERAPVLETSVFGKVDYQQRFTGTDVHLLIARWAFWRWERWTQSIKPPPLGTIVPYTSDPSAFFPASPVERLAFRRAHEIPEDAFLLGRIGQSSRWKWDPVIFEAFEAVAKAHPHAYLLLVGLPEALRPRMEALAPWIRARIVEIPFLTGDAALRAGYSALDVFIHAARIGESFGMVLAEAMLCGCPVVTLSTPARDNSQLEVVGHMRGGLVVNDAASMADAVKLLIRDEPLRRRLAHDGAAHVKANYTLDQVIPTLLRVARAAREADTRDALAAALEREPDLVTHVPDAEVETLLTRSMGRVRLGQRALKRLVHIPLLFRTWWAVKGLRYGALRSSSPLPSRLVYRIPDSTGAEETAPRDADDAPQP